MANDPEITRIVRERLLEKGIRAVTAKPIMGAEDFAFYMQVKPGVYFNVGTRNPQDKQTFYPPHNSHFCIDEHAMEIALETLLITYAAMTDEYPN